MKLRCLVTSGCLLASAAAGLLLKSARADTPAFTSGGSTPVQPPSFTGTKGWSFYNYNQAGSIWITQLGVFDSGADGLVNAHQVGLWGADGTLLASATVPVGVAATLFDGYRYVPIPPVAIPRATSVFHPHSAYVIAAQYSTDDADDRQTPVAAGLDPGIGPWTGDVGSIGRFGYGSNLPFPNMHTPPPSEGSVGPPFWEPNFQFTIPEPSPWLLVSPALFLVLRRRRQAP
jgi:hypothetical protein